MAKKMPLDIDVTALASGDTYDYIESDQVPPGEIWAIQICGFENQTGARGTVRRYKGTRVSPLFLEEEIAPSANELVWSDAPVYLRPGQKIGFRQATCTAADVLRLYATGYRTRGVYIDNEPEV